MEVVHAHYAIIRQFVCRVSLQIDPDDWNTFADELNKYIPGIGVLPVRLKSVQFFWSNDKKS